MSAGRLPAEAPADPSAGAERRKFKRLNAPVFVRPAGRHLLPRRSVGDISVGGMRVYSDDPHAVGSRLEMDLMLPDGEVVLVTEVVWIDELPEGAPARFDVGLRFVDPPAGTLERIAAALGE